MMTSKPRRIVPQLLGSDDPESFHNVSQSRRVVPTMLPFEGDAPRKRSLDQFLTSSSESEAKRSKATSPTKRLALKSSQVPPQWDSVVDPDSSPCFYVDLKSSGLEISFKDLLKKRELLFIKLQKLKSLAETHGKPMSSLDLDKTIDRDDEDDSMASSDDDSEDSYYDTNDPFIDDSDIFDVAQSNKVTTEIGGFFVQDGGEEVQVKVTEPVSSPVKEKKKKKRSKKVTVDDSIVFPDAALLSNIKHRYKLLKMEEKRLTSAILMDKMSDDFLMMEKVIRKHTTRSTRKTMFESVIASIDPSLSFQTLRKMVVHRYDEWTLGVIEMLKKSSARKLKGNITRDVKRFQVSESASQPSEEGSDSKYRCKWEPLSKDLVEYIAFSVCVGELEHKLSRKKNEAEKFNEDKMRLDVVKEILQFWPDHCQMNSSFINDAYKRYKERHEFTLNDLRGRVESGEFDEMESKQQSPKKKRKSKAESRKITVSTPKVLRMSKEFDELPHDAWKKGLYFSGSKALFSLVSPRSAELMPILNH